MNLMTKMHRKQLRLDELTNQLLFALVQQNSTEDKTAKEAAIMRSAIYRMAQQDLPEEQFKEIVAAATDLEKVVLDI